MTDRAALEALMRGPIRAPEATKQLCPECGNPSVAASGAFRRCVTPGCGWAALVRYARPRATLRKDDGGK